MNKRTWMKATHPLHPVIYWYAVEADTIVGYKVEGIPEDRFFELTDRPRADDTFSRLVHRDGVVLEGPFDEPV